MQSIYETYISVLFAAEMVGSEFSHTSFIDYIYTFTCCYYSPDTVLISCIFTTQIFISVVTYMQNRCYALSSCEQLVMRLWLCCINMCQPLETTYW